MSPKPPAMKRVTLGSVADLSTWLVKNAAQPSPVMFVVHSVASHPKHISNSTLQRVLADHGWASGPRYTINAHLVGQIAEPSPSR